MYRFNINMRHIHTTHGAMQDARWQTYGRYLLHRARAALELNAVLPCLRVDLAHTLGTGLRYLANVLHAGMRLLAALHLIFEPTQLQLQPQA